jgi:hypothetical protein
MIAYEHIRVDSNYLGSSVTNQNSIQEKIKCRLKAGNSCYYSLQTLLSLVQSYTGVFYIKVYNREIITLVPLVDNIVF